MRNDIREINDLNELNGILVKFNRKITEESYLQLFEFLCEIKTLTSPTNFVYFLSKLFNKEELCFLYSYNSYLTMLSSDKFEKLLNVSNLPIAISKKMEKDLLGLSFFGDIDKDTMESEFKLKYNIDPKEAEKFIFKYNLNSSILSTLKFLESQSLEFIGSNDITISFISDNFIDSDVNFRNNNEIFSKAVEIMQTMSDDSYVINVLSD